jgi:pimeloyl-ACP methyl ester carboxylesterase
VSAIPPSWKPDRRARFYLRAPQLLSPLFCLAAIRLYREIAAATPGVLNGIRAAIRQGLTAATHMFSPSRMARRVHLLEHEDLQHEFASVRGPVLIITGEVALERVVPVALTREYLSIWPQAEARTLAGTGHLGLITKPAEFAQLIGPFVQSASETAAPRRRIG